jgi:SAM-dependent methyltransferase
LETPVCIVCGSEKRETALPDVPNRLNPDEKFTIAACSECGFWYLAPRPDEQEIARYYDLDEYHPHHVGSESVMDKIYRAVRVRNLQAKRKFVNQWARRGELLDIGCGTGEFPAEMKANRWTVSAMETAPEARAAAEQKEIPLAGNLEEITGGQRFDAITMWHVLEHVHRVDELFKHIKRLLKPDGTLVIAVPNRDSLDARRYGENWVALDTPRHLYHFRPRDMRSLAERNGLYVVRVSPMLAYDPFYNVLLSQQLKDRREKGGGITGLFRAAVTGKMSYFGGIYNPEKCASPVYVIRKP